MMIENSSVRRVAELFEPIVGAGNALDDLSIIKEFSEDLIYWGCGPQVECVIRPANTEELSRVVKQAVEARLSIAPRGAGLSYTQGYVPSQERMIAVDLSRLNEIHEFNQDDGYMVVGAGATWQQVAGLAKTYGLRPVLRGPISGSHSTVGGAASQGIMGRTDGFLSFEVVMADGRIVTTGSGAATRSTPFYRHFGPDLTGLFSGDTGAFGIKTKVALKLEPIPDGLAMASFSFTSMVDMVDAIIAISRLGLAHRLLGMDPLKARTASRVGVIEAGRTIGSIATGRSSLRAGLSDALSVMKSGREALNSADWALHIHAEAVNEAAAAETLKRARDICLKKAVEISPTIAIALNARPYSVRGMVGLEGERFVPIHAMFPLSRARGAAEQVERFLAENQSLFAQQGIATSCLVGVEDGVFVIEPMFYWPDELGPLHRRYLPADKLSRLASAQANPQVRATVIRLRDELRKIFFELGAIHGQIGKYYDFKNAVEPAVYDLLSQIKALLDPDCRLNPGNFAWFPPDKE